MTPLARIMTERGISGAELARHVGCTRATISALATGRGQPRVGLAWAIARALAVESETLWSAAIADQVAAAERGRAIIDQEKIKKNPEIS